MSSSITLENKKVTPNTLKAGESLIHGQSLISANKKYEAKLRSNGNFILIENKRNRVKPLWSSLSKKRGEYKLTLLKIYLIYNIISSIDFLKSYTTNNSICP